jgi:hydrogenase-4 component B
MMALDFREMILLGIAALYGLGALAGLTVGRRSQTAGTIVALACATLAGLAGSGLAIAYFGRPMQHGRTLSILVAGLPGGFPPIVLSVFVDRLAAFFLLLTAAFSTLVAIYSFTWLHDKPNPHRISGVYNALALAAILVLVVNNIYLFLVALECLTLAFAYLTLYRHDLLVSKGEVAAKPEEMEEAKLAFKAYLIFSHIGVIFITAAFVLLALARGTLDFDGLRLPIPLTSTVASVIFVLALIGFGIKAAVFPAQSWMALTHPYLPTGVHALVSSVIIKVAGIYGLLRILFEFLHPTYFWWGWILLMVAGLTAVVGVFYAITGRDMKTALANHSVENIGIILAGIAVGLLFSASGTDSEPSLAVAGLGLVAALYHILNHGVFKSLLFLATGAIENRTSSVKMELLGGLMRRYRWTGAAFLVGAVSIAGFPPFNGFISEWLTLQALFAGLGFPGATGALSAAAMLAALVMLGAAFGLTALAFTKIVGEVLLGAPRDSSIIRGAKKGDVSWPMRGPLILLAAACLALGVLPGLVVRPLELIAADLLGHATGSLAASKATDLVIQLQGTSKTVYSSQISIIPVVLLLAVPFAVATALSLRRRSAARGPAWTCGTACRPEAMQITGGAFAFLVWSWAGRRRPQSERTPMTASEGNWGVPWRLLLSADFFVIEYFRRRISAAVQYIGAISERFGAWFQGGDIRQYLGYLFAVFILALAVSLLLR